MSQSSKLSLWQRIKQLLSMATDQATIHDTKIDNDLDSDLSSDSSLTKQDKKNAYLLENEGDSNKDNGIESDSLTEHSTVICSVICTKSPTLPRKR